MTSSTGTKAARPLSPHLQVYKPQMTSMLSILHRLTGIAMAGGLVIFVAWVASLARGPQAYADFLGYAQTIVGKLILFGLTFSFFFHLCNGIRHLLWDVGMFLELKEAYKTGRMVIAASVILTAVVWLEIYGVGI